MTPTRLPRLENLDDVRMFVAGWVPTIEARVEAHEKEVVRMVSHVETLERKIDDVGMKIQAVAPMASEVTQVLREVKSIRRESGILASSEEIGESTAVGRQVPRVSKPVIYIGLAGGGAALTKIVEIIVGVLTK